MTRFSITLDQGVDFVISCLERMWGGELFVPKIPSYKIMDVVKAILPSGNVKDIGIRSGEKLHEEMITNTDSLNTIEFRDYFVILPSIPLWDLEKFKMESSTSTGKYCKGGFSYNSLDNKVFLSVDELKVLINQL